MVARNESAFIRACIESALPVVDEAIVVDTGSVDGTPDLARKAGARVIERPWPGDLGTAHDLPLAQARTDWVLSLDGDERLDAGTAHLIPALVHDTHVDGYRLPIRNYSFGPEIKLRVADTRDPLTAGARCYYPTQVVRLHRRRAGYHHRGRLHQSLEPSIVERGGALGDAPVIIHHYGPLRSDREKAGLYRILARRQTDDTPLDARAWFDLGMLFCGSTLPAALDAFRRAYRLGLRGPAAFMIGSILLDRQEPRASARWLRQALVENPRDDSVDFDLADVWEALGSAFEALGHARRAERALSRALECRPHSAVAANNLAGLLIERGAVEHAERVLAPLLDHFRGVALSWSTLGVLRLRQHALEGARQAFETAIDISPCERIALLNLALTHRLAGRRAEAARAARAASHCPADATGSRSGARPSAMRKAPLRRMPPGGVVTLALNLQGGPGRVIADAVRALRGRPQIVLCANPAEYSGLAFAAEIERQGVDVRAVGVDEMRDRIAQLRPACVIDHRGPPHVDGGPARVDGERWIAVGHAAMAMPPGYDAYAVLSAFHARFQRHLPRGRVHRIGNGVDLRRFRRRPRQKAGRVTIAMVSRLDPGKFPRQLLSYLPDLAALDAQLLVAGRGARRHEIEPEIEARGLTGIVRFAGVMPSARIPRFLAVADIGLHLTEIDQENCSVAVLELLASGLPVVSQPKGCLPEMVAHGVNGYLASDPRAIAAHLAQLIESPALRVRMGAASRRAARAYRIERYRTQMRELVARTIAARPNVGIDRADDDETSPEDVSLMGWRPRQTFLICATRGSEDDMLSEALAATGIAGLPRPFRAPSSTGRIAGRRRENFARALRRHLEACATPNGVSGAVVSPCDLERLLEFEADLPQLRLIRITRGSRMPRAIERTAEERAWDALLARWKVPQIHVCSADLVNRRGQTTRSVVRALAIPMNDALRLEP